MHENAISREVGSLISLPRTTHPRPIDEHGRGHNHEAQSNGMALAQKKSGEKSFVKTRKKRPKWSR